MAGLPSGGDPNYFDLGDFGTVGAALSFLSGRTQTNVENFYRGQVQASQGWGSASNILFYFLDPTLPFPAALMKALAESLLGSFIAADDMEDLMDAIGTWGSEIDDAQQSISQAQQELLDAWWSTVTGQQGTGKTLEDLATAWANYSEQVHEDLLDQQTASRQLWNTFWAIITGQPVTEDKGPSDWDIAWNNFTTGLNNSINQGIIWLAKLIDNLFVLFDFFHWVYPAGSPTDTPTTTIGGKKTWYAALAGLKELFGFASGNSTDATIIDPATVQEANAATGGSTSTSQSNNDLVTGIDNTIPNAPTFGFLQGAYGFTSTAGQSVPYPTGFLESRVYYYVVTAVKGGKESVPSAEKYAIIMGPARITITWTASTTSGVTYNVYRGDAPGKENIRVATGLTATTFTDSSSSSTTSATPGTTAKTAGAAVATTKENHQNLVDAVAVGASGNEGLSDVPLAEAKDSVSGLRQTVTTTAADVNELVQRLNGTSPGQGVTKSPTTVSRGTGASVWGSDWTFYRTPSNVTGWATAGSGWFVGSESGSSSKGFGILKQPLEKSGGGAPSGGMVSLGIMGLTETGGSVLIIGGGDANSLSGNYVYAKVSKSQVEIGYGKGFTLTPVNSKAVNFGSNPTFSLSWYKDDANNTWTIGGASGTFEVSKQDVSLAFTPGGYVGAGVWVGTSTPPLVRALTAYPVETTTLPGVAIRLNSITGFNFTNTTTGVLNWNQPANDENFTITEGAGGIANAGIIFKRAGMYSAQLDLAVSGASQPPNGCRIRSLFYYNGTLMSEYAEQIGAGNPILDGSGDPLVVGGQIQYRNRYRFNHLIPCTAGGVISFAIQPTENFSSGGAILWLTRSGIL